MNKPELNDALAKTKIREHKTFGGKTIEILYDAKDENGNAVMPKENFEDGHGIWSGIKVGEDYRMFSWKHSKSEGGAVEYGTSHEDHALEDMEADVVKRKEIVREVEETSRHYEGNDIEDKMNALKKEWEGIETWDVPAEKDLEKRYDKALSDYEPRQEEKNKNKEAKSTILSAAEEVKNMENFKAARAKLDNIRTQLQEVGSAGDNADKEFHNKLNAIEREVVAKQKEYHNNLEANRTVAKAKKEELLVQIKELVAKAKNYKDTDSKINKIFEEWRTAGSAGREDDERLWKEFNEVRAEFRKNRHNFFVQREESNKKSIETKNALIEEASKISASKVFDKKNTERMKQIDKEWKAAGFSGKENNDKLWDEFNAAKEVFWDAKKQDALKRISSGIEEKQKALDEMLRRVDDMKFQISIAPNPAMKEDLERELRIRENEVADAEEEIEEEKKRLQG